MLFFKRIYGKLKFERKLFKLIFSSYFLIFSYYIIQKINKFKNSGRALQTVPDTRIWIGPTRLKFKIGQKLARIFFSGIYFMAKNQHEI